MMCKDETLNTHPHDKMCESSTQPHAATSAKADHKDEDMYVMYIVHGSKNSEHGSAKDAKQSLPTCRVCKQYCEALGFRTWVWILTGVEWTSAPIYLSTVKCETGWPVSLACCIKWNLSPTLPWSQSRNPTCCRNSLPPSHRLQVHRFGIQIWQKVHKKDWLLVLISSWRLILLREQLGNLCLSTTIL